MRRRVPILVVALLLLIAAGTVAALRDGAAPPAAGAGLPQPPDSRAPPGSPPHWIPSEDWVMQHWLPYDEERLLRLLRVDRETLWRHLRDDRRTIAQLAAGRGWPDPERLAAALVAEPRGRYPSTSSGLARCGRSPRGTSHSTSCSTPYTRMRFPTTRGGRSACTAPTSSSGCADSTSARSRSRG